MRKLLLLPFLLAACVEGEPEPTLEVGEHEIANGEVIDTPESRAIVFVNGPACSGTFIHPYYVLTAAHCLPLCNAVTGPTQGCFTSTNMNGDDIVNARGWMGVDGVVTGYSINDNTWAEPGTLFPYTVDRVFFPRAQDFDGYAPPDMALLHVTTPYRGEPMRVMPWGALPTSGSVCDNYDEELLALAGYSRNGGPTSNRARRFGFAEVDCVWEPEEQYFRLDADTASGVGSRSCKGDSGGPVMGWDAAGKWIVAGIVSGSNSTTCEAAGYTVAAYVARHMLERIAAADPMCAGSGWDACVANLTPAPAPGMPVSPRAVGKLDRIEVSWTDGPSSRVRISRDPPFPNGYVYDLAATPGLPRFLNDTFSSGVDRTKTYRYTICAVNTLEEQVCTTATYVRPLAQVPWSVSATAGSYLDRLFLHYSVENNGQMLDTVRIYRNGAPMIEQPLGENRTFEDTRNIYAYTNYTYSVCTVSTVGEEACATAKTDTYGGTIQCPQGKILCGGVCKPVWQCDFWE